MAFDLKNLNPPTKFTHDDGWSVWIRPLSGAEYQNIQKQVVNTEREFHDGQVYTFDDKDETLESHLTWDYCIVKWDLKDSEGKAIECSMDNKILLMGESQVFMLFVNDCIVKLAKQLEKAKRKREKN